MTKSAKSGTDHDFIALAVVGHGNRGLSLISRCDSGWEIVVCP
jgi:hypothetical protein